MPLLDSSIHHNIALRSLQPTKECSTMRPNAIRNAMADRLSNSKILIPDIMLPGISGIGALEPTRQMNGQCVEIRLPLAD